MTSNDNTDLVFGIAGNVFPSFIRISWVSDQARNIWSSQLRQLSLAWRAAELRSVQEGVRKAAIQKMSRREYEALNLNSADLIASVVRDNGISPTVNVLIADKSVAEACQAAILTENDAMIGYYLGYPECCTSKYIRRISSNIQLDPTWLLMADQSDLVVADTVLDIDSSPERIYANLLWQRIGIRATPHMPCNLLCRDSRLLGEQIVSLIQQPYGDVLLTILSWPVEWSTLHGIVEVKTPIIKYAFPSIHTFHKYVARWKGSAYPAEGAVGTVFPFEPPARRYVTDSPSYLRALASHGGLVKIEAAGNNEV